MRIFATGDIHGDSALAFDLAEKAEKEKADLVVISGDLTHGDAPSEYIIGPFKNKNMNVIFVPGNHDSFATADFLSEMYSIKNLHGSGVRYGKIGFFGAGGANIGVERLHEDELFSILNYGFEKINYLDKKIMVTHVHPSGTLMEKFTSLFPGSSGVRKAVEKFQPDFLLCSHVHEAEGIEEKIGKTTVINVGRQGRLIDLTRGLNNSLGDSSVNSSGENPTNTSGNNPENDLTNHLAHGFNKDSIDNGDKNLNKGQGSVNLKR